jgi:hypothetical protein
LSLSFAIEEKHKRQAERLIIIFCKYKTPGWFLLNAHTHIDRGVVLLSSSNPKVASNGVQAKGTSL